MGKYENTFSVISHLINFEINFWTGFLAFVLLLAGLMLYTAVIFSTYVIKNSYKAKAKILGYVSHPREKIKNGETIIEETFNLVYEYTNTNGELTTEVGSDWSDTHSQYSTGTIVTVRVSESNNYDDVYLNISNTIKIFLIIGTLLILLSALVVFSTTKSLIFFWFILITSILCLFGIGIYAVYHQKHNDLQDKRPINKILTKDKIKSLEEFSNPVARQSN